MKPVDRYVQDVMRHVFAVQKDRDRLEADLRAHFSEAEARGEAPGRISDEMGRPEDIATAFNAEREIRYAGFWQRVVAFIGDCGLLAFLALPPLSLALLMQVSSEAEPTLWQVVTVAMAAIAVFGIFVFYFPILEARFGKTLGKQLLRIRVIRETGAPIGLGQAFVRRLSLYFKMLMIDALFIPFTDKKQRALDIVAKTVVARDPGETAPWWAYAVCLLLPVAAGLTLAGVVFLCAPY